MPTIELPTVNTGRFVFGDRRRQETAVPAPTNWLDWLHTLFPKTFTSQFAPRQEEFWQWVDNIEANTKPSPSAFFAIWPRESGKTTSAETAVVRVGAKQTRNFVLYVRSTQDKANQSIQNIGAKLESREVERHYPQLASRKLGKYGHSRGWRMDLLRTDSDFNVLALGLDAAVRGVKLEDYRPDLIIFDDIDDKQDTPQKIKKKLDIITTSIIPAGANHCAYLGVQNLIHALSIFSMVVEGTADFLYDRRVSGPHPAVEGLAYESKKEGGYRITGGTATWEAGQPIDVCEKQINEWGLASFLQEAQHDVDESGGIWDHVEFRHIEYDSLPVFERGAVWVDPAVTNTDESDCHAIAAGGHANNTLYILHGWEQITSPEDSIRRAILLAIRYGLEAVGVETDQGGDTWLSVYKRVCDQLLKDESYPEIAEIENDDGTVTKFKFPTFKQAKAGAGHGSKVHRNSQMMVDYEHGKVIHVIGTHNAIEKALRRFPKKPLDLADVLYWLWYDLADKAHAAMTEQPKQESRFAGDKVGSESGAGRWKRF